MRVPPISFFAACLSLACVATPRDDNPFGGGQTDTSTEEASSSAAPGDSESTSSAAGTGMSQPPDEGSSGGEIKLDVGNASQASGADDEGGGGLGCEKVDFLFVVDNSGSMEDEQTNLVASFEGFITTIQETLMAQDYHVMVVDTDAASLSFSEISCTNNVCTCGPQPQCCFAICSNNGPIMITPPPTECAGMSCDDFELPEGCPVTLGAGRAEDPLGNPCGIEDDRRFMTDTQSALVETFECVAKVGAGGDGNERPMDAMIQAVSAETAVGGCHEGFLRDDAILVVTFITDEEEEGSMGDPGTWRDALVEAKNGNEEAVVVLGLLGDTGQPGAVCGDGEADDAPRLRQFAESFTYGSWASVCAPSYNDFFDEAVGVIDTTCSGFDPEG